MGSDEIFEPFYAELLALQGSTAKADKAKLLRYDIVR